jgi:hypothetical protein
MAFQHSFFGALMKRRSEIFSRADFVRDEADRLIEQLIEIQTLLDEVLRAEARQKVRRKEAFAARRRRIGRNTRRSG